MAPEHMERALSVARERYMAMTPADWRRVRRELRRQYWRDRLRAWFC